jgi:hypothetical protein
MVEGHPINWDRLEVLAELFELVGKTLHRPEVELWRSLTFPVAVDLSRRPHSPERREHIDRIDQIDRRKAAREPPGSVGFVAITKDDADGLVDTLLWLYRDEIESAAMAADIQTVDLALVDVSVAWVRSLTNQLRRIVTHRKRGGSGASGRESVARMAADPSGPDGGNDAGRTSGIKHQRIAELVDGLPAEQVENALGMLTLRVAPGWTSVRWGSEQFTFKRGLQANLICALFKRYAAGQPIVHVSELPELTGEPKGRRVTPAVVLVEKGVRHPALGRFVVSTPESGKGTWTLRPPPTQAAESPEALAIPTKPSNPAKKKRT